MRARFVRACVHAEHREREGQPACPRHSHAEHLLLYPKVHALEKPTRAMPRSGEPQKLVAAAVEDPVHHKQLPASRCLASSIHRTFGDFRPQILLRTFSGSVLKLREDACHV